MDKHEYVLVGHEGNYILLAVETVAALGIDGHSFKFNDVADAEEFFRLNDIDGIIVNVIHYAG